MEKKPEPHSDGETLFTAPPLPVAPLDDEQRLACLRLARSQNVGSVTFCELINQFGGAQQALDALPELARNGGRRARISICSQADAEIELEAAMSCGARPLFTIEPGYPRAVALIDAPPPLIYVRGRDDLLQKPAVAIVGSRLASAAGLKLAAKFAHELGQAGLTICSGLARGIDGEAHRASLDSGTIAVVAGGVDIVYPPEHADLHQEIAEKGVVISMMPCGFQPRGKDFPRRNRLIAAVSLGILVMEAARRSGTLTTARFAGELGRDVFAVPGHPLDPRAEGTNSLLKSGAILTTQPEDVLETLQPLTGIGSGQFRELAQTDIAPASASPPPLAAAEADGSTRQALINLLGPAPVDFDALVRASSLPVQLVRAMLIELDLAGRIDRHGNGLVSLREPTDQQ